MTQNGQTAEILLEFDKDGSQLFAAATTANIGNLS